jgi:FtsP/CotA-like multicopper oxidase with cupredoxin domain
MSRDRDVLHGRESAFKHLRRMRSLGAGLIVLCTGWLLAAAPAQAQKIPVIPCAHTGKPAFGQELEQPRVIRPFNGVVDSSLVVRKATYSCIPAWIDKKWVWQPMTLRTYYVPKNGNNPHDPNLEPAIPGPTFRIRKALLRNPDLPPGPSNPQLKPGTRLRVLLKNQLPVSADPNACDPSEVLEPPQPGCEPNCDKSQRYKEKHPDCYHGAEVTNLHLHGTHISPQPHQDYIFLELYPESGPKPAQAMYPTGVAETGQYQVDVNPFPWNQAPGTHWYHAHKHASTALQVLNGMSGALLIEGPFDDWLYGNYKVDPNNDAQLKTFEKLLVVQQIWPELSFYKKPHPNYPPPPLVNGQAEPKIKIRYGEVQRLRFIGATMQAAAELTICFDSLIGQGYQVRQIAQDGVQFAKENWDGPNSQPLIVPDGKGCKASYFLAPGNRADFLVKAPPPLVGAKAEAMAAKKLSSITYRVSGNLADEVRQQIDEQVKERVAAPSAQAVNAANPVLFSMELSGTASPAMSFPTTWPAMPYFLRDVTEADVAGRKRTVAFSMTDPATGVPTAPAKQPNGFWIDKTKYNPGCANQTMVLGTAEQWTVTNDSSPNHPFHIHVNPFQVVRNDTRTFPKPIWQDTIALPVGGCNDVNAGPLLNQQEAEAKCPGVCTAKQQVWDGQWTTTQPGVMSVCGCCTVKSVELRSRFEDYSGGYVYHCHFLGHEDRGMMHNVQTVCPAGGDAKQYGTPRTDGEADDCGVPNPLKPLPVCTAATGGASAHAGHQP